MVELESFSRVLLGIDLGDVDRELERIFSTRRAEIEQVIQERGWNTARGADIATLDSRGAKKPVPISILRQEWKGKAERLLSHTPGADGEQGLVMGM